MFEVFTLCSNRQNDSQCITKYTTLTVVAVGIGDVTFLNVCSSFVLVGKA